MPASLRGAAEHGPVMGGCIEEVEEGCCSGGREGKKHGAGLGALLFIKPGRLENTFTYSGSIDGPYRNVSPLPLSCATWLGIWDVPGMGVDTGVHRVGEEARSATSVFTMRCFFFFFF